MGRKPLLWAGLATLAAVGCATRPPYPDDPLFLSRKPVRGTTSGPAAPLLAGPAAPDLPDGTLAALQSFEDHTRRQLVAARELPPQRTIPGRTVSRKKSTPPPAAHAADFSWVRGVLIRDDTGFVLRYAPPGSGDPWGGMVFLDPHPLLAGYRDGDAVRLEGAAVREHDQGDRDEGTHRLRYRLYAVHPGP